MIGLIVQVSLFFCDYTSGSLSAFLFFGRDELLDVLELAF